MGSKSEAERVSQLRGQKHQQYQSSESWYKPGSQLVFFVTVGNSGLRWLLCLYLEFLNDIDIDISGLQVLPSC